MLKRIGTFLRETDGPTATEYAVMLAFIIVVAVGGISLLGQTLASSFGNSDDKIHNPR